MLYHGNDYIIQEWLVAVTVPPHWQTRHSCELPIEALQCKQIQGLYFSSCFLPHLTAELSYFTDMQAAKN